MRRQVLLGYIVIFSLGSNVSPVKANASILSNQSSPQSTQGTKTYDVVAYLPAANATLLASKRERNYEDFIFKYNGNTQAFPYWRNVDNPTNSPKMFFDDIDQDGKKEIIIALTTGTGTGVNEQEVHVLHENTYKYGKVEFKAYYANGANI